MRISLSDINKLQNVAFIRKNLIKNISGVSIDSRNIKEGEIFFAIKGANHDGHEFVKEVFKKGASCAVIDRNHVNQLKTLDCPLIVVDDTIKALGQLGNIIRKKVGTKIIGITGSNGKTTTKEMIAHILSTKFNILKTEGNLNNQIGIPLNLFRLKKQHHLAVIEMGINQVGEMSILCDMVEPDYGAITNVGTAHIEFFGSVEAIAKEKGTLFKYLGNKSGLGFVNNDDKNVRNQAKVLKKKFTFGFNSKSDVKGKIISVNDLAQPSIIISYKGKSIDIELSTYGLHTASNALCAAAVGLKFGIGLKKIKEALESFKSYDKRMQVIRINDFVVINDSYNANPDSMKMAIRTMNIMKGFEKRVAILGDMLELGEYSEKFHRELAYELIENKIDKIYLFGDLVRFTLDELTGLGYDAKIFDDKKILSEKLRSELEPNSLILLKGSRKMKMEDILNHLRD